jgi:hypothetical protein
MKFLILWITIIAFIAWFWVMGEVNVLASYLRPVDVCFCPYRNPNLFCIYPSGRHNLLCAKKKTGEQENWKPLQSLRSRHIKAILCSQKVTNQCSFQDHQRTVKSDQLFFQNVYGFITEQSVLFHTYAFSGWSIFYIWKIVFGLCCVIL